MVAVATMDPAFTALARSALGPLGAGVSVLDSPGGLAASLDASPCAAVVVDLDLPGGGATALLSAARERPGAPPVVAVGSDTPVAQAVAAMRAGAADVVEKPRSAEELSRLVAPYLGTGRIAREPQPTGLPSFAVGRAPSWLKLVDRVQKVARLSSTVLIRGETGAGKEIVSKLLVALSPRASAPFVALNCATLPETLIESELFGHVRGAFSSATTPRRGLFEEASGGTLFLDEIGSIPPSSQAKLLRVLEEGRVRRVGDNRFVPVDVRILAATSLDIEAAIARHEFREDLFFRLSVVSLHIPPLRERISDVPLLAEHFLARMRDAGAPPRRLSPAATELLLRYPFPGNVRELKHAIEQASVFADGEELQPDDFSSLRARAQMLPAGGQPAPAAVVDTISREQLEEAFARTNGNRLEAARVLGISRSSLYRILRKLPVEEQPEPS